VSYKMSIHNSKAPISSAAHRPKLAKGVTVRIRKPATCLQSGMLVHPVNQHRRRGTVATRRGSPFRSNQDLYQLASPVKAES
jgi:hypothetical protein